MVILEAMWHVSEKLTFWKLQLKTISFHFLETVTSIENIVVIVAVVIITDI